MVGILLESVSRATLYVLRYLKDAPIRLSSKKYVLSVNHEATGRRDSASGCGMRSLLNGDQTNSRIFMRVFWQRQPANRGGQALRAVDDDFTSTGEH